MESKFLKVFTEVKSYVIMTLGLLLYALGWIIFVIPNNMVGGGVTGIGAILLYAFNIPVSVSFFVSLRPSTPILSYSPLTIFSMVDVLKLDGMYSAMG